MFYPVMKPLMNQLKRKFKAARTENTSKRNDKLKFYDPSNAIITY